MRGININKRKNFLLLLLSGILLKSAWDILVPILPSYLFKHTGSTLNTGIIMGSAPLVTLIFRPVMGKMIKKAGVKKFILLGLTGTIAGTLLFPFFTGFGYLLLARMIQGSGLILFFFSSLIMVSRMVPASRRGELFGLYTIVFIFPLIFSPMIGSFMEKEFSFKAAVFFSSTLIAFSIILSSFLKDTAKDKTAPESGPAAIKYFFKPILGAPLILIFFLIFTDAGIITFLPLVAEQFNIENFALYFSLFALSSIATRLIMGKNFDRLHRKYLIGFGTVLSAGGILIFSRFSFFSILAAGFVYGIGYGFTDSNLLPMLMSRMKGYGRETAVIVYSIVFDSAYLIAPPVLGFIGEKAGFRPLYISCAFIILIETVQ